MVEPEGVVGQAVERTDYVRRSPFAFGGPGGHKEWLHFCVLAPGLDLLVNFSLSDDVRAGAHPGSEHARVTLLLRDESWDGDVETFSTSEVAVRRRGVDLALGGNRCLFRDGAYRLAVTLQDRPVSLELVARPVTLPALAPNIPLPDGPPLHWAVVPRLCASGRVTVAGRTHTFTDALAYHDHNWGHFLWGQDMSWEWGFALPDRSDVPWSLAFVRLTNRGRTHLLAQGLFLWHGRRQRLVFREHDVVMRVDRAYLRPTRVFKIPRIMALLSPDLPTDVPRSAEMEAHRQDDWVRCRFDAADLAQVVIPSEAGVGVTIINEVCGRMRVGGVIGGECLSWEGRGFFEFLNA